MFMLSISNKSHLIRHSGMRCAFKSTQRALKHLRHSESTRALGHSESTQRGLGHWDAPALGGHGHLEGTWKLGHLRYLDTRTVRALGHLRTSALNTLRHLATWALGALYIAGSVSKGLSCSIIMVQWLLLWTSHRFNTFIFRLGTVYLHHFI